MFVFLIPLPFEQVALVPFRHDAADDVLARHHVGPAFRVEGEPEVVPRQRAHLPRQDEEVCVDGLQSCDHLVGDVVAAMAVPLRFPPTDFVSRLQFLGISVVTSSPARLIWYRFCIAPCAFDRYSSILSSTLWTRSRATVTAASAAMIRSWSFLRFLWMLFSSAVCATTAAVRAGSVCWAKTGTPPAPNPNRTAKAASRFLMKIDSIFLRF